MNPNTEYERFTQEIYRQLSQATMISAAIVKHNHKIAGRSGQKHQIDVYWEYEKDGKTFRVAIECKNYRRRITLEKVCAFNGVLIDLEGVSGIMVTKVGFQKGAKKYAQEYGISLKELRLPKEGETIIGETVIHQHFEKRSTLYLIDEEWAAKNQWDLHGYRESNAQLSIKYADMWRTSTHLPLATKDHFIRNAQGIIITSLDELEKRIPDHPTADYPFVFKFKDAYVESRYLGPVKILEIKYTYEVNEQRQSYAIDAGSLVKAILKDSQRDVTEFVVLGG